MTEQLTLIEEVPKSQYVRRVERILYDYPALKAGIENDQELTYLYPSMISQYGDDAPRGTDISKPTEKFGVMRAEKTLRSRQIERALNSLKDTERHLVNLKYFDQSIPSDEEVMFRMEISNTKYYRYKDQAIRKVAIALNII